ncbi:MAG: F0F1 ATP synthase subunit delta [Rhodovibrionaceae bacterium]
MASEDTSTGGLAGRYASALFELADEQKKLDKVAEDLTALKAAIDTSEDLAELIRSPLYGRDLQAKAMGALLDKMKVEDLTRNFVLVIVRNRRLFVLRRIADAYLIELARRRGEVTAQVTAASELSEDQKKALTEALGKSMSGKVQLDVKIDPAILGGLIVRVGSRMIDSSVRSKLQRLKFAMKGVG